MSTTRSSARLAARAHVAPAATPAAGKTATGKKRKAPATKQPKEPATKKAKAQHAPESTAAASGSSGGLDGVPASDAAPTELVPAVLTFSYEDAKRHLIAADSRFEDMFARVKCRPFEHLERLDPFRTLCHSILGQQISWKAAASITHKFIRLFDPSIPELAADYDGNFFPSAAQVTSKDVTTLRTAGLSGRKAEYVLDLASRFADGRLSTQKLLQADDDELYAILTAVKGIGKWTVHMFAIFSLRRPDILPHGDLGVQRGMVRWFLAQHSSARPVSIAKHKLADQKDEPALAGPSTDPDTQQRAVTPDVSAVPPAPEELLPPSTPKKKGPKGKIDEAPGMLPVPLTPSTKKIVVARGKQTPPPLPAGLTVAQLKTRLDGKKKIKGAFLTPEEMVGLTEAWRPYRSIGVYYMWALAEDNE